LERKFETFPDESVDTLISHGLQALSASLQEGELTKENCTLGIVGADMQFTLIEGEALLPYLAALKEEDIGGSSVLSDSESECIAGIDKRHYSGLWPHRKAEGSARMG